MRILDPLLVALLSCNIVKQFGNILEMLVLGVGVSDMEGISIRIISS